MHCDFCYEISANNFGTVVVETRMHPSSNTMRASTTVKTPSAHFNFPLIALSIFCILGALVPGCKGSDVTQDEALSSWTKRVKRQTVDSDTYLIQRGDQIEITVTGYPEYNTTALVKESGVITVPLVGDLLAVQQTKVQITDQLTKRLSDYVKGVAVPVIKIKGAMEQKVIVLGSVTTQGSYAVATSVSTLQALAMAGGPNAAADLRHVRIYRSGAESPVEIDITGSLAPLTESLESIPEVNPGDLLYVPKEENVVRDFADLLRDVVVLFGVFAVVR
jgi:protein involved in polysaccharide export with SLBB domain